MTKEQGLNLVSRNERVLCGQLKLSRAEVVGRASGAISQATLARLERGNAVGVGPEILFDFR